ncbi:hypothetical protein [Streptomyces formicae]|uniref:Uncharacterized protein n=1 Tax=Streptomyces formicae TaxID=1616117 RepID=A0ABY3WNY9_9ACTN|nr:hypothetical protein [Streptomyces formicae]UNM13301.1 hypothetical protein J4032_18995 [Streptomyces formicae]
MTTLTPEPPFDYEAYYSAWQKKNADSPWQIRAKTWETNLGVELAEQESVKEAARRTIRRLHEVLTWDLENTQKNLSSTERKKKAADAFFLSKPKDAKSAGQIKIDEENALQGIDYFIDEDSKASVREMMTALFNAAYFGQNVGGGEGVSLKSTIQRIYFTGDGNACDLASRLKLNHRHLEPYTNYLKNNAKLVNLRSKFSKGFEKDIYAVGSLANYGSHFWEYASSQICRQFGGRGAPSDTFPSDYLRLGPGIGLSEEEREFQNSVLVIPEIDGLSYKEVKSDIELTDLELRAVLQEKQAIQVQNAYSYGPNGKTFLKYYTIIEPAKIIHHNVRSWDLDSAAAYGPEYPLPWVEGFKNASLLKGPWYVNNCLRRGYPLVAGLSGTAARMFCTFAWINVPETPAIDFVKALLAWMLPVRDHSVYEILKAVHIAMLDPKDAGTWSCENFVLRKRKERLLVSGRENGQLDELTVLLKKGAKEAYQGISERLGTKSPTPHPKQDLADLLTTWAESRDKAAVDHKPLPSPPLSALTVDEASLVLAMAKYLPLVTTPGTHPDQGVVRSKLPVKEAGAFFNGSFKGSGGLTRYYWMKEWLDSLHVAGKDIVSAQPWETLATVCGVYVYSSGSFTLLNAADKVAPKSRAKAIRDTAIATAEKDLNRATPTSKHDDMPVVITDPKQLGASWEKALGDAREANKDGSTEAAKKQAKQSRKQLIAAIKAYDWRPLDEQLKMCSDAATTLGGVNFPVIAAGTQVYRGTYKPKVSFSPTAVSKKYVTSKITSTSRKYDIAERFAHEHSGYRFKTPVLDTITFPDHGEATGLYAEIYGLSRVPSEAEVIIFGGVTLTRTSEPKNDIATYNGDVFTCIEVSHLLPQKR